MPKRYDQTNMMKNVVGEGKNKWMLTFADLLSLILTFFVLLYSMSVPEIPKWQVITESLSQRLKPKHEKVYVPPAAELSIPTVSYRTASDLNYLKTIIEDKINDVSMMQDIVSLKPLSDRLIIELRGKTLFEENKVSLSDTGMQITSALGIILESIGNHIDIYGYYNAEKELTQTNDWLLSVQRAYAVSSALQEAGYTSQLVSYGRGNIIQPPITTFAKLPNIQIIIRPFPAETTSFR